MDIVGIASSSPRIKKKRGISIALMMQRSGTRSIVPSDMIWKSAKLFCTTRRCHHHQHRWPKSPVRVNIIESIPTVTSKWEKSM
jgi:hypothetical protein